MRSLVRFFALAYGISWLIWMPRWLPLLGVHGVPNPNWVDALAGLGPALAALFICWHERGSAGVRLLVSQVTSLGRGWYWAIALAVPLFCLGLCLIIDETTRTSFFTTTSAVRSLKLMIFFGFGEEIGWRGFVLPRLQNRMNALSSSLLLSIFWMLWHLPLLLDQNTPALTMLGSLRWIVLLVSGSVILTWLFNESRGSVLVPALFHGAYDLVGATGKLSLAILSIVVLTWALTIILYFKPRNLADSERVTA